VRGRALIVAFVAQSCACASVGDIREIQATLIRFEGEFRAAIRESTEAGQLADRAGIASREAAAEVKEVAETAERRARAAVQAASRGAGGMLGAGTLLDLALTGLGAAAAAYLGVNHRRDAARRVRGEPVGRTSR
jgi:hypothetical protein